MSINFVNSTKAKGIELTAVWGWGTPFKTLLTEGLLPSLKLPTKASTKGRRQFLWFHSMIAVTLAPSWPFVLKSLGVVWIWDLFFLFASFLLSFEFYVLVGSLSLLSLIIVSLAFHSVLHSIKCCFFYLILPINQLTIKVAWKYFSISSSYDQ